MVFALGASAAAQTADDPAVNVENASVSPAETERVTVTLSDAPGGLSGYSLRITLGDDDTAALTNASTADQFGLANATVGADGVTLSAVDTDDAVGPGATDVVLGAVTIRGETAGTTELAVTPTRVDDDSGTAVAPATAGGTVTVETTERDGDGTDDPENGSGANQSESNQTTDDSSDGVGPGFGAVAAVLALIGAVLFSLGHRKAA